MGQGAARILREADAGIEHIYISAITLMEVLYLAEAGRIDVPLAELVAMLAQSRNYELVPVDADIVLSAIPVDDVPELHDRILVATAVHLGVPILTGDRVITASRHVQTVW